MADMVLGSITNFFVYETAKSVVVKSWTVGIINRVAQLLIILYFICWVFLHEKAYQDRDTGIESTVMTKVKGLGTLNDQVVDVADYVSPPQGSSTFCIITKMIITANQTQGRCPESEKRFSCSTDANCTDRSDAHLANGMLTGRCLNNDSSDGQCEIQGWCPAENDQQRVNPMKEVENFTILIKNSIRFPRFNVSRGSIDSELTPSYMKTCNYDAVENTNCPIFKVGYILDQTNQTIIIETGGEIGINIAWKCNLDHDEKNCKPQFSFTRLDTESKVSKGYNFRFAKYYKSAAGSEYRTLHKAYAIRFEIIVSGNAGKFSTVPFMINFVAALTSVGLAAVFCDLILLNFLKGADVYKAKKFEEVSEVIQSPGDKLHKSSQMSIKSLVKRSNDSGNFSIGQQEATRNVNQNDI
ncbi:P2X purinoceptor 3a [Triplophysa rosa]|uniref:P2X purinoceptor n=1 Tax=Triplophysa rosa TaxID=992332 RepID=A0A9W7TS53_TRIRA|nr:P2X purinoceptor 3a [Triplophysa rosa]XP_057206247.1 P2X purinoceptor 3a [Triplophysa rosa]KAI7801413.1 P2rx3a protein [Triplophysa rosa]